MTLSILELGNIFNNKEAYSVCTLCGCAYKTENCLCIRVSKLDRYFGEEYLSRTIRDMDNTLGVAPVVLFGSEEVVPDHRGEYAEPTTTTCFSTVNFGDTERRLAGQPGFGGFTMAFNDWTQF